MSAVGTVTVAHSASGLSGIFGLQSRVRGAGARLSGGSGERAPKAVSSGVLWPCFVASFGSTAGRSTSAKALAVYAGSGRALQFALQNRHRRLARLRVLRTHREVAPDDYWAGPPLRNKLAR